MISSYSGCAGIREALRIIGDVRALILGLPKEFQDMHHGATSPRSGDAALATVPLEIVLLLNGVLQR